MITVLFFIFATTAIVTALLVIFSRNTIYSALFLVMTLFSVAGIFLLLEAYFLAAVQVIVYAGAIMVLFLFVIMLLNLEKETKFFSFSNPKILLVSFFSIVFLGFIFTLIAGSVNLLNSGAEIYSGLGSVENIGLSLFTKYLLPFEITSLLLLVALVGAVLLSKKSLK